MSAATSAVYCYASSAGLDWRSGWALVQVSGDENSSNVGLVTRAIDIGEQGRSEVEEKPRPGLGHHIDGEDPRQYVHGAGGLRGPESVRAPTH